MTLKDVCGWVCNVRKLHLQCMPDAFWAHTVDMTLAILVVQHNICGVQ